MRRPPAPPLDPTTIPPTALIWLLLGRLGWAPRNGAFLFGRFVLDADDERHVVYVHDYRRLDVRRLSAAVHPDGQTRSGCAAGEFTGQRGLASTSTPPLLFRLGGYRYGKSPGCMHDWHRRKVTGLLFGALQAPLLEQANWRLPGHVLIAGGDEVERMHLLEAIDFALCPEGHRPARTPAGSPWSHLLVGQPIAWWRRQQWDRWEDVREALRWRQRRTEQPEATRWARRPELLIVAPAIERSINQEIVRELLALGPDLRLHLLATTDQPHRLSLEQLGYFDTRLVLPGGDAEDVRRLLDASWVGGLAAHEVLLAQFARPEQEFAVDGTAELPTAAGTEAEAWMAPAGIRSGTPALAVARSETAAPPIEATLPAGSLRGDGEQSLRAGEETGKYADGAIRQPPSVVASSSTTSASTGAASPVESEAAVERSTSERAQSGEPGASLDPATAVRPNIEIRCFGGFEVSCNGRQLANTNREREWAILGYLASQPAAGVTKEQLGDVIWPGADGADRDHRLNQCLFRLRAILAGQAQGLPRGAVGTTRQGICRLDPQFVRSDAQQFLTLLEAAKTAPPEQRLELLEQARQLVTGPLFKGQRWAWLDERGDDALLPRQRFEHLWREATWALVKGHQQAGQPELAIGVLRDRLRQQPTDSKAVGELFRLLAQGGDRQGLSRAYDEHIGELRWRRYSFDDEAADEDVERARIRADAAYTAALELLARKDTPAP